MIGKKAREDAIIERGTKLDWLFTHIVECSCCATTFKIKSWNDVTIWREQPYVGCPQCSANLLVTKNSR